MTVNSRSSPCPCGSNHPYKDCCGKDIAGDSFSPEDAVRFARLKFIQYQQQQAARREIFGDVRPHIHCDFNDHKIVAVGSQVLFVPKNATFPDFLTGYLGQLLGKEWAESELRKPRDQQLPLARLWNAFSNELRRSIRDGRGKIHSVNEGAIAQWIQLAYDCYLLQHHSALQAEVLRRLKLPDLYQSARYELAVASLIVRAGFDKIAYQDSTRSGEKVPEFIATRTKAGEVISVEAKCRYRATSERQKTPNEEIRAGITRLLHKALQKSIHEPFVVFIDLNLPSFTGDVFASDWFREIANTIARKERRIKSATKFPATLLIFTNFPQTNSEIGFSGTRKTWISTPTIDPQYPFRHDEVVTVINRALDQYSNIPKDFEEQ